MPVSDSGVVETAPSSPTGLRRSLLRRHNERAIETHALVRVRRMPLWQSSLVALLGLAFVLGIAVGEMALGGAVVHAFVPARHFDIYFALHQQLVVGSLIGVSLLWLLPPHPWATRLVKVADRAAPADRAGEAGVGGTGRVSALSRSEGRNPFHRPEKSEGVGG